MRKETSTEYTCENCHGTFDKGWTDEEAALEMNQDFGDYRGDIAVVCDDCYKEMTAWKPPKVWAKDSL